MRSQCKSGEVILVMGDMKTKVGEGHSGNEVENFDLRERNERGDRWVEWCESWEQVIMNTFLPLGITHDTYTHGGIWEIE